MSKINWPEYGFGLVLTDDEAYSLCEEMAVESPYDLTDDQIFKDTHVGYYDDEMDGKTAWMINGNKREQENILVFWAKRQPDAFKPAYESPGEAAEEFRKLLKEYLPEGFDYEAHLGYFSCSICC